MLGRVARPGRWAVLSASAPKAILIVAYWRLHTLLPDLGWSGIALVLAGARAWRGGRGRPPARRQYRNRNRDRRLCDRSPRRHDPRRGFRALDRLAQRRAGAAPAGDGLDRRPRPPPVLRRLALGVAGDRAGAARPQPLSCSITPSVRRRSSTGCSTATACRRWPSSSRQAVRQPRRRLLVRRCSKPAACVFTTAAPDLRAAPRADRPYRRAVRRSRPDALNAASVAGIVGRPLVARRPQGATSAHVGGIVLFAAATVQIVLWQMLIANPLGTGNSVGSRLDHRRTRDRLWPAGDCLRVIARGAGSVPAPVRNGPPVSSPSRFAFFWLSLEIRHVFRRRPRLGVCGEGEW